MGCSVPSGSESSTPRPVFETHFSAQEDPTLSGVSSIFYDLAEANPLVTFLFSIFHMYVYIYIYHVFNHVSMNKGPRISSSSYTVYIYIIIYIYVHLWVLRETGVFYSWTWICCFPFSPIFHIKGASVPINLKWCGSVTWDQCTIAR